MALTFSTTSTVQYDYDNDAGTPVSITSQVLEINEWDTHENGMEVGIDGFGTAWEESRPTGRAQVGDIEFSGIFSTDDASSIDELFRNRATEGPDADTRTFKATYATGRTSTVETRLISYSILPNLETGLTRYTVKLKPTGTVTTAKVSV